MSLRHRVAGLLLLAFPFSVGCASTQGEQHTSMPHPHGHDTTSRAEHQHAHGPGHFSDPSRYVASWNSPERDAWQHPEEIIANLGLAPGMHVVDLGAGTGYLVPKLSAAVGDEGRVTATDVEPAMVDYLREVQAREGWRNVEAMLTPTDDPRLVPESIDAIVTLNVWHHVDHRTTYAKKLYEALRPGGVFLVVDYLPEETEGGGPPLAMRLSAEAVMTELRDAGFVVEQPEEGMPRHYLVRGKKPSPAFD
ncbi:MAG: class I SAM-dependent methyltransferase [Myxococcota bacterium]